MTLIEMLNRNVNECPSKPAIIYRDIKITYKGLAEMSANFARSLTEKGLTRGGRVAFMLQRTPELVISFLSVAKARGIAGPVNFELLDGQIKPILADIAPQFLIVQKRFLELARRSIPASLNIQVIVAGGDGTEGALSWDEMLRTVHTGDSAPLEIIDEDEAVYLNFTSGATGSGKGAVTTHSNIYWNTLSSVDALKLTHDDVHLCLFAPFAHPHEIFARPLYLGGTMVLLDNIYPKSIAEAISRHGVTCMMGLAPMYETLLEQLDHKGYDLSSLRILESGGMHTRRDLIERARMKIGVPVLPVWGSTETSGIAIANTPGSEIPIGSVGKPCPTYEVKIVDERGEEAPAGETGELIFRGPAVVQGYYKDPENTAMSFRDGWYYSGDLGRMDGDGNFYFVDRKNGMMKMAGLKVYPMEIELALMEHPLIKEAAVIPVRDKLRGETPKAIVVARDGARITEKEVVEFCRERLPGYKVPRLVEVKDALPKVGSGKVDKKALKMEETSTR